MTKGTAIVLIALVWGRTGALSMLVSLAARRTHTATAPRAALPKATIRRLSNTRSHQGIQATPRRQPPVTWRGKGSAWAMSTASKGASSLVDGLPKRFVCRANLQFVVMSQVQLSFLLLSSSLSLSLSSHDRPTPHANFICAVII